MSLNRLPTADELLSLCDELGIRVVKDEQGRPALRVLADDEGNKAEGTLLAKLLRREPWRSQVLAKIGESLKPADQGIECLWPGNGYVGRHDFPESGWPIGAYFWRRAGETQWQPIPGREWQP